MPKTEKTPLIKKYLVLLCITLLLLGCKGGQEQNTARIELEGNQTTGYTWVYTMSPEDVVREVSNKYIQDKSSEKMVGVGGKFVFTFEAITEGEADLFFSYLRPWEEDIAPVKTVIYKALVDNNKNLVLTEK